MNLSENWAAGRIALVTGATSGFGEAMARRVLAAGGKVIATGRREDRLARLAQDAPAGMICTVPLDVSVKGAGQELLAAIPDGFREVDILFNNAGLALGLEPAHKADLEGWETMIATNVAGLARVTHAILPGMVERNRGHIINLSSIAANYPYPGGNIYGGTKAFVRQFSLNLRSDLLGTRVKVTSLEPGLCETEFSVVRFGGDTERARQLYAGVDALTAEDVIDSAEAVLRLPEHLNVNTMEIMPVQQAAAPLTVVRGI